MTTYLLAGGGTAGHVNPLLAVADRLRLEEPDAVVFVLGTAEGLEARLVPAAGYELVVIERLPFPRRPGRAALRFLPALRRSVRRVETVIRERDVDVVVGFGGYAAAPAYLAARNTGTALAIHEANARPGLANRLGSRYTDRVGVAFAGTKLPHARVVGMPLRRTIAELDTQATRPVAYEFFGLSPDRPTLLVTGGSLGARRVNATILDSAQGILNTGYQVLHIQGSRAEFDDPHLPGYRLIDYCDRMDFALAVADFAVCRAGAGTVSELTALGIPAVYVPFPVGNGEQRLNAQPVVSAGGGMLAADAAFDTAWVTGRLLPLLADPGRVSAMSAASAGAGTRDGSARMVRLIRSPTGEDGSRDHT